jgi:tRNA (cytidine/uridine-2'-O-)-methyltransferase
VCAGVELLLVGDLGFRMGDKYLERAGMDYLKGIDIRSVPDFETVTHEKPGWQAYYLSTKAQRCYTEVSYDAPTLLVFGSEDKGLPEWLIAENPQQSIRIPMTAGARSLNLANAVAIVLYEALRQRRKGGWA